MVILISGLETIDLIRKLLAGSVLGHRGGCCCCSCGLFGEDVDWPGLCLPVPEFRRNVVPLLTEPSRTSRLYFDKSPRTFLSHLWSASSVFFHLVRWSSSAANWCTLLLHLNTFTNLTYIKGGSKRTLVPLH